MQHAPIGIVVNPSSGKDVRRLVAKASVFDNREKSAIVRRALVGAINSGAKHFAYMDDSHNISASAFEELPDAIKAIRVPCPKTASAMDTEVAASALREIGCIATLILGGDGTSRVFVKGWREAVLLPVSTGTNNVFPRFAEATIAGAALGFIASGKVPLDEVVDRVKIVDIQVEDEESDIALIDAVITDEQFVGARALLEGDALRCAFLTRAEPAAVGITSIGGLLHPVSEKDDVGLLLKLGKGRRKINAPIAPGLYQKIKVSSVTPVAFDEAIEFQGPCVIALDGEREKVIKAGQKFNMRLSRTGPCIVDIEKTMKLVAALNG
jgi:predicted polyphosphate/ATP-dependent NAD kinase